MATPTAAVSTNLALPMVVVPINSRMDDVPEWAQPPHGGYGFAEVKRRLDENDRTLAWHEFKSDVPILIFGRDPAACHIFVGHPSVSPQHAVVAFHNATSRCIILDLESANGTFINNMPLEHTVTDLHPHVRIRFGDSAHEFIFKALPPHLSKRPITVTPTPPPQTGPPSHPPPVPPGLPQEGSSHPQTSMSGDMPFEQARPPHTPPFRDGPGRFEERGRPPPRGGYDPRRGHDPDDRRRSGDMDDRRRSGQMDDRRRSGDMDDRRRSGDMDDRRRSGDMDNRRRSGDMDDRRRGEMDDRRRGEMDDRRRGEMDDRRRGEMEFRRGGPRGDGRGYERGRPRDDFERFGGRERPPPRGMDEFGSPRGGRAFHRGGPDDFNASPRGRFRGEGPPFRGSPRGRFPPGPDDRFRGPRGERDGADFERGGHRGFRGRGERGARGRDFEYERNGGGGY